MQIANNVAERYTRFARQEAEGKSELYVELALGVAGSEQLIALLAGLPREKQQPNLIFAAYRWLFGVPRGWDDFHENVIDRWDDVRNVALSRMTQTNEPGRCATLLPLLARLPQPLALIEVGASAGLCLLPDYYSYQFGGTALPEAPLDDRPIFSCNTNAVTPVPETLPEILWRAGLDLNPLDVTNEEEAAWLECLVWPGQEARAEQLRKALEIARAVKPEVVKGDLRADLADLAGRAPKDATLVIFHTAVLTYVQDVSEREAFSHHVSSLCPYWISNESPGVFPSIAQKLEDGGDDHPGKFLMSMNGEPIAWTDPHGRSVNWIETSAFNAPTPS
ncbi:DUF2332 domain-containing protein [Tianweitania populi]|uniref:DUF2332 domain-containing protein n=1 Tax=Tianweitania populi TaxID=1607949 RepID=A0A8J3GMI7_9HYPH|nr:DUF2332 domain-containing protein [Tianweitania populi]GHD23615.1 hypothetical protein GCM10016234_38970 [Tianweitania populi]